MSLKMFLYSYLFFVCVGGPMVVGNVSDKHRKRFNQDISEMEMKYQDQFISKHDE